MDFLASLPREVRSKITYNVHKCMYHEDAEVFKKLQGTNIWEFRTPYNGIAYRLFAFWDKDGETLVVATHGIVKKKRKTPQKEIDKAEMLRKKWFNEKTYKQ